MRYVVVICLALVSCSTWAGWEYGMNEKTAGPADIRIDGKPITLMPGVASGVCVEEVGSRNGKLVRLPDSGGFEVKVTTRKSGDALLVTADITDTKGGDSAADVLYQIPLDVAGWAWHQSILTSTSCKDRGSQTEIPISVLTNSVTGAGLAVAITPVTPCMYVSGYDKTRGLYVKAKVGFSDAANPPSRAKIQFAVYPVDAEWGFRSALKTYYDLFPKAYEGKSKANGLWIFKGKATMSPNPTQFSFHSLGELGECRKAGKKAMDLMTPEEIKKELDWGIEIYPYVIPGQREVGFLDSLKGEAAGKLREMTEKDDAVDLESVRYTNEEAMDLLEHMTVSNMTISQQIQPIPDYIRTVKNSYLTAPDGWIVTRPRICEWSDRTVTFPQNPNPFIPGGDKGLNAGKAILNDIREWLKNPAWSGIYVDSLYRWGAYVNYRKEHFPYAEYGLTYGEDGRPCLHNSLEHLTFLDELRKVVGPGRKVTANGVRQLCFFHAQRLDAAGSEFGPNQELEGISYRRSMMYHKPYLGMAHALAGGQKDRRYIARCFLFGMYGSSDMVYFTRDDYAKLKDLYDTYIPIERQMFPLGWEPVTYARPSAQGVKAERFGHGKVVMFSLYHDTGAVSSTDLEIEGTSLKLSSVKAIDPVSGKSLEVVTGMDGRLTVRGIPISKDGIGVVQIES